MTISVVELLEVVRVDHQQSDRLASLFGLGKMSIGTCKEGSAVGESGQSIGIGQPPEICVGIRELHPDACRDVGEGCGDEYRD